jgi:anti-sigma factor RsiW
MQNINERPVCHRAEDLVTYLYGESTAEEARDFSAHLAQCDACRAEFGVFNRVHDSIVEWRNEALGSFAVPTQAAAKSISASVLAPQKRKLSAWAALREFFTVSPLWLRGATAFAGLLVCALIVLAVSRTWNQQATPLASDGHEAKYSEQQLQQAVKKEAAAQIAKANEQKPDQSVTPKDEDKPQTQGVARRSRPKTQPANKLTYEERVQLAADLGLIPRREDEQPFMLPDGEEPNQ